MKGFKKLYPIIGSLVMAFAVLGGVHVASWLNVYQPQVPRCLK